MADNLEFYPVGVTSEIAKQAIQTAAALAAASGVIYADGEGGINNAVPGTDFGYPMLTGMGVPTQFTVGALGQFYYNLAANSAPYIYVCVDQTQQGYQWEAVGGSGSGFRIMGYFNTLELLQNTIINPQDGDAYGVGTSAPYTIYVFDGITHTWKNNGTLGVGGQSSGSIPPHGETGQALVKRSDASGDVEWRSIDTEIQPGSITAEKLADGSVSADFTVTIPSAAWSGSVAPFTASVTVTGLLATDKPMVDLIPSESYATAEAEFEAWGMVYRAATVDNRMAFYATDKPTVALNVQIKAVRK